MGDWVDRHWVAWSVVAAGLIGLYALVLFRDWRAAALGALVSGAVNALGWRPGGFGHRIRRREQALEAAREAAGEPMARPGCLVAMGAVAVLVIASALVGVQIWE